MIQPLSIEIIQAVKLGDRKAFRLLYDTYALFAFNVSYKLLKDKSMAEEVVQECFVNLWLRRQNIDETKAISSLIFVMAKRTCLNNLRKIKYANTYLQQVTLHNINDIEEKIDFHDLERSLVDRIALLPKQQRTAFQLSRMEGYTHQQIAEEMGISPHTVKNHISQALMQLRKCLSATHYELPLFLIFLFL